MQPTGCVEPQAEGWSRATGWYVWVLCLNQKYEQENVDEKEVRSEKALSAALRLLTRPCGPACLLKLPNKNHSGSLLKAGRCLRLQVRASEGLVISPQVGLRIR